jgi:SPP1 family predicted phage head-tail adaptor
MATKWTNPGEMRKRITIQSVSTATTPSGETTGTTGTVTKAWAKIAPLSGREAWLAKEQQDTTSHKINMLYQPGITAKMQAVYEKRVFNFTAVRDLEEMHRELEIMATEVIAA